MCSPLTAPSKPDLPRLGVRTCPSEYLPVVPLVQWRERASREVNKCTVSARTRRLWCHRAQVRKQEALVVDLEDCRGGAKACLICLVAPSYGGLSTVVALFFIASRLKILLDGWCLEHDRVRFELMATTPFLMYCRS
ncbi:hypothetical protein B0H10DRAFT_994076 [Mycena sp. CBHHK59/15]|nr:hypothetical protein B0H10DRAFT_994076 [Mycena sp. CBHHK59/15]